MWLVSHSMPHACAAWRMAMVSVGALVGREMACRALLYLCQAPWSSLAGNRSLGGRVLSGIVAAGGSRLGMMRSMYRGPWPVPVGGRFTWFASWTRILVGSQ